MIWGSIIAWYLFLAGLGAGAYMTSALVEKLYPEAIVTRKIGRFIAPCVVIIGLMLLMVDAKAGLFHPWRFALLLTNIHSVMSWGVVFLSLFVVVALFSAAAEFFNWEIPSWFTRFGIVLAISVAAYTGVLLGVVKTFPLWNTALLPILFLVSACSAGMAASLGISLFIAKEEVSKLSALSRIHLALPVLELVLLASLLFVTSYNSTAAYASVVSLVAGKYALVFWLGLVVIGLILPLAVELMHMKQAHHEVSDGIATVLLTECSVLIGGFLLRYLIIVAALPLSMVN